MPEMRTPTAVVTIAERARRRWSQTDLGDELKKADPDTAWSRARVRRLEAGELVITVDVLQALAQVFDLDYATLIDGYATRGGGSPTVA